jgi:hypothetical protein
VHGFEFDGVGRLSCLVNELLQVQKGLAGVANGKRPLLHFGVH